MLAEFLDKLLQETKNERHEVDSRTYYNRPVHLVAPPEPATLYLATLTGLVDYIEHVADAAVERFVSVDSPHEVSLRSRAHDGFGRRQVHAVAKCVSRCVFPFAKYLAPEDFLIGLQTNFILIDGDDLNYVLGIASGLSAELVSTADDDGLSQRAAVKQGVALKQSVTVKRTVQLYPYRTFDEVTQPASTFLFRLRTVSPERPPECALFLADGEAWRNRATQNIKNYLETQLGDDYVVVA